MTHDEKLIRKFGPLIQICCLKYESKHRELKAILNSVASRVNTRKSVAIRYELAQMCLEYYDYNAMTANEVNYANDEEIISIKKYVNSITDNDVIYKAGSIIVIGIDENGPFFGKIEEIYEVDQELFFVYQPLQLLYFDEHYFAYLVALDENDYYEIMFKSLPNRIVGQLSKIEDKHYVAFKYARRKNI